MNRLSVIRAAAIGLLLSSSPAPAHATEPPEKAIALGRKASLTLSAEARLRYDSWHNGQLTDGNEYRQGLLRGILGADLRVTANLRLYGELGTGQVEGRRGTATPNFQNDASLQQLFVEARGRAGSIVVGATAGRQEFADGPRQLLSLSDGPNLHRTWNGVRVHAAGERLRIGAYDLRATRHGRGSFDEAIHRGERLQGINGRLAIKAGGTSEGWLEPFWIHSENRSFRSGGRVGLDERDTRGVRVSGRRGELKYDWTLAHQTGESLDRDVEAWGLFAVQSLGLSGEGWKPRLTARVDLATAGYHQLYASSSYLGEGQFLSLKNLLMVTPGISVSPTARTTLSAEYGFARRLDEDGAAYAGGMRPYAGTEQVPGHELGGLLRVTGSWSASRQVTWFFNYEYLDAGHVLARTPLPSGSYANAGVTLRY